MDRDACEHPAEGPPPDGATPAQANDWRLRTPEGRALYKRRAPDAGDCTPASKTASGCAASPCAA